MKAVLVLPGNDDQRSSAISQAGAEHLGLGYIAAFSRKRGHEVAILNFQLEQYISQWEALDPMPALPVNDQIVTILATNPEVVGVSVTGLTIREALAVTNGLKQANPNLHICWGGHHAYQSAEDILEREQAVDSIVVGDGEIAFAQLLDQLAHGEELGAIPGLWYRQMNRIRFSGVQTEPELDSLPYPARDSLEEFRRRGAVVSEARMSTSRGCQFDCTFCVDPALGYRRKWRARSARSVVDEIEGLVRDFGVSYVWFNDDNFIPPSKEGRRRAGEIARLLIERQISIGYRILSRADAIHRRSELLSSLMASGLTCVYLGIESGSERRLKYFKKRESPELYREVIAMLRQLAVGIQIGFIMFDPLTTWSDLENDAQFLLEIEELYLYSNYSQVLDVFPGTEISRVLIERGLLESDFTYDSPVDRYHYGDRRIGRMARAVQAAYKGEWIEMDKFFQRLRVSDLPKLTKRNLQENIPGFEDFCALLQAMIERLNQRGLDFFFDLLTLAENGWNPRAFRSRAQAHLRLTKNIRRTFLAGALRLPPEIKKELSALQPYL